MSLVGSRDMCLRCASPLTKRALTAQSSSLFPVTAPGSSHAQLSLCFFLICSSHRCLLTRHTLTSEDMSKGPLYPTPHLWKGTSSKCYRDPILGLTLMIPAVQQEQTFLGVVFVFTAVLTCMASWSSLWEEHLSSMNVKVQNEVGNYSGLSTFPRAGITQTEYFNSVNLNSLQWNIHQ